MFRRATQVLLVFAVALVALSATAAFAVGVGPQANPVVLKNYSFETATTTDSGVYYSYQYYRTGAPGDGDYWWGRATGHGRTGAGLWNASSNQVGLVAASYGSYPGGRSQGEADFALGDTTGWYKSDFSYWYYYPSYGGSFGNPFGLGWYGTGVDAKTAGSGALIPQPPTTSSWTQVVHSRTGGTTVVPATAGTVKFSYIDWGGSGPSGAGITVDDVAVTGYKYGPARNLSAARVSPSGVGSTTVNVSWAAPYDAANSTTPDVRTMTYHVYR
ncbi:MAG: hypothetical protein WCI74_06165, partial [Actinomycetes bacterium]